MHDELQSLRRNCSLKYVGCCCCPFGYYCCDAECRDSLHPHHAVVVVLVVVVVVRIGTVEQYILRGRDYPGSGWRRIPPRCFVVVVLLWWCSFGKRRRTRLLKKKILSGIIFSPPFPSRKQRMCKASLCRYDNGS